MKRYFLLLSLLAGFFLFNLGPTYAHSGPPFILVNDVANLPNPAGSGSVFFKVPNEIAANSFAVNEALTFKIDTTLLPVDPSQINPSDFLWEFGNNQTGTGLNPATSYSKAGSYIVILKVKDPSYQDPIELESMQVNILPNRSTQVPKAVIKVNGKLITDPFQEPVLVDKNNIVKFSARDSEGQIKSYKWDFGDGSKLETAVEVEHKFDFSQPYSYSFFPILRVEDENGVYTDSVVQIANSDDGTNPTSTASAESNKTNLLPFLLLGLGLILFVGAALFWLRRKSK